MFQTSTTDRSGAAAGRQGKPVKPKKKWWSVLKVIVIIIIVKILINITLANYFSPDNKVKRYLHAKYGSNRELTVDGGCSSSWLDGYRTAKRIEKSPWEWSDDEYEYCSWRASFKDDPNTSLTSGWTITMAIAAFRTVITR